MLQYDLDLVFVKNSHDFVHEYMKKPEHVELMRRLGALGDGNQDQSKLHFLCCRFPRSSEDPCSYMFGWNSRVNLNYCILPEYISTKNLMDTSWYIQVHYRQMSGRWLTCTWPLSWRRWAYISFIKQSVTLFYSGKIGENKMDIRKMFGVCVAIFSCTCIILSLQRGQPDRMQPNTRRDKGKMQISKEDILYINGDFWGEEYPRLTGGYDNGDRDQMPVVLS